MFEGIEKLEENELLEIKDNVEIKRCNAYQLDVSDDCLIMNFGEARQLGEGRNEVTVLAKIALPLNNMYLAYLLDLYQIGKKHEEESGETLFPSIDENEDESIGDQG